MRLLEMFPALPASDDREIEGICIDSRKAEPGDLFFCLKGTESDGHRFAGKACRAGACAVVCSDEVEKVENTVYIKTEDVTGQLNRICDLFCGRPGREMTVFGVTGTNGKTTVASIIEAVYGKKVSCGYMGTVAVRYGGISKESSLTTPDAVELHSTLREMRDHGVQAVAMEVSSHGLAMRRTDSVDFDVAVFTNLTYDHLDFHGTMENYFEAKKRLFMDMKPEGTAVLNVDDVRFRELRDCCRCDIRTYGIDVAADYRAENIRSGAEGSSFTLVCGEKRYEVKTNLSALYNVYNLLGAVAAMNVAGMEIEEMLPLLSDLPRIDGRLEHMEHGQDFHIIVDYAHTPDGFEQVMRYAQSVTAGDLYCVFGCAGKRDKNKREMLGRIAGKYCRKVFVTEEDPRDEKVEDIAEAIMEGAGWEQSIFIADRRKAIEEAINTAGRGDCVLILGKGREIYMDREDGRQPWMGDDEAAQAAIEERMRRGRA